MSLSLNIFSIFVFISCTTFCHVANFLPRMQLASGGKVWPCWCLCFFCMCWHSPTCSLMTHLDMTSSLIVYSSKCSALWSWTCTFRDSCSLELFMLLNGAAFVCNCPTSCTKIPSSLLGCSISILRALYTVSVVPPEAP